MKLRFGLAGLGYFGKHYARLLQHMEEVELGAVVVHGDKEIPDLKSSVKRYADAGELFGDREIDCVVIATPPSTHAAFAIAALEQGKHVLLEKPMATSVQEAEQIVLAAKKQHRTLMIGHQYCYNDYVRHLKEELDNKSLGDVGYLFAQHLYAGPVRLDIGCFWETATHELSIIDYLFSRPKLVKATGQMLDMSRSGRDDFAACVLTFDNGLVATITTTWFAPEKSRRMILGGTHGMALFDEKEAHHLTMYSHEYPKQESPEPHTSHFFQISEEEKRIPDVNAHEPLKNQVEHFIDCVVNGNIPLTDGEHGLRITRMLDEITTSMTSS